MLNALKSLIDDFRNMGGTYVVKGGPGWSVQGYERDIGKPSPDNYVSKPEKASFSDKVGEALAKVFPGETYSGQGMAYKEPQMEQIPQQVPQQIPQDQGMVAGYNTGPTLAPWVVADKAPIPDELIPVVLSAAQQYGIDPLILASAFANESGGNETPYYFPPEATGASGEVSPAQIIPEYHYGGSSYTSPSEYEQALRYGGSEMALNEMARILSNQLSVSQDPFEALARYNAGPNYQYGYPYAEAAYRRIGRELPSYIQ